MKKILLKSIILCIILNFFLVVNILANDFRNNNQGIGIFKSNNINNVRANNISAINGINPGGDPNGIDDPIGSTDAPIGDGWWILSSLGLAYGFYLFLRKRKQEE